MAIAGAFCLSLSSRLAARGLPGVRVGIMDGILGHSSRPEAIAAAARLGFEGVQITLGKAVAPNKLTLSSVSLQARFREAAKKYKIALASTYLDVLHVNCLKNDPLAPRWIREGIAITGALNAGILMLVFFGKCSLESRADCDSIVKPLRAAARDAQNAGIVLGFENTLSAKDNMRILEQVGSPALKVWYDIGNSTNIGHYDAPAEIRALGRERICQFHIKDKGYLGDGAVNVSACLQAIADIGFHGFTVLETAAPSGDRLADAARNLGIYRKLMDRVGA
jgi:sugar phosphate isomerase/epimerase